MSALARCRSCNADMLWVRIVASGRRMPVDRRPVAGGNVRLLNRYAADGTPDAEVLTRQGMAEAAAAGDEVYRPHWSTCPNADRWRRR